MARESSQVGQTPYSLQTYCLQSQIVDVDSDQDQNSLIGAREDHRKVEEKHVGGQSDEQKICSDDDSV